MGRPRHSSTVPPRSPCAGAVVPLPPRCSLDWLLQSRTGTADGALEQPAPGAAGGAPPPGMAELVKITGCEWQLCAQALAASGDDPQR